MVLDELTREEERLMNIVGSVKGDMDEKDKKLREMGVFAQYLCVHRRYAELMKDPEYGVEALKRAFFIQWYRVSEPSCFTGISEVEFVAEKKVFNHLEKMLNVNKEDEEVIGMLWWYNKISDWYLSGKSQTIDSYVMAIPTDYPPIKGFEPEQFQNRGQMGNYWVTVL